MYAIRSYYAEPEEIKYTELRLWENIKRKANEGRRTGIGITAEGDMLAALGLRYGSENAVITSYSIHYTKLYECASGRDCCKSTF